MSKGIYAAASAMVVETRALEITARNLAHAQSPGWKKEVFLRSSFAEELAARGRQGDVKTDGGAGVLPQGGSFVFTPGSKEFTGGTFDLAIDGDGFFRVRNQQGELLLTRAGQFTTDEQGKLVDVHGWAVEGQAGPINIPADADRVQIQSDGSIVAEKLEQGKMVGTLVDRLRLTRVDEPAAMTARNGQYFDPGTLPANDATAEVKQGYLERGNVEAVHELVSMIAIQRRYEAAQKALREQSQAGSGLSEMLRGA